MPVLKTSEKVLLQEINNEAILLNLTTETYFKLNSTALRMWHVLSSSNSLAEAIEVLANEFDVDKSTLETDILELIETLKHAQLAE